MERPLFDPQELKRYSRHTILPQVGEAGQRRLKESALLLVGLGGLGSALALYLAAAGIGCLGLVDGDAVEESNLQRQIIHDTPHVGMLKVASAAQRIHDLNPHVQVETHAVRLEDGNAAALISPYAIVLDATDNFSSRYRINHFCVQLQKPMIYGAVYQFEGQVSVFAPHLGSPCYCCVFRAPVPDASETIGIFGALPGVIGSLQALEALKLLLRIGKSLLGSLLLVDTLDNRYQTISLTRDPECPVCGKGGIAC